MGTSICRHVYRQAFKMGFRYRLFKKVKNNQIVGDRIRNADLCDQKPPLSANIFTASVTRLGDFLEIIDKYFFQKLPKCLVVFWALLKTSLFNSNCCGYFLVSQTKQPQVATMTSLHRHASSETIRQTEFMHEFLLSIYSCDLC